MAKVEGEPRRLATVLRCTRCRADKQKCVPEGRQWPQKCNRCTKSGHDCSPGRPSRRGQQQSFRQPEPWNEGTAAGESNTESEYLSVRRDSIISQEATYSQLNEGVSLQVPSLGPSEASAYMVNQRQCIELQLTSENAGSGSWQQSSDSFACASDWQAINVSQLIDEHDAAQGWRIGEEYEMNIPQRAFDDAHIPQGRALASILGNSTGQATQIIPPGTTIHPQMPSSLILIEPSNHRVQNKMIYWMDKRMEQLWGNYKTFANTKKVSELFSWTVSEFFSISCRQMAWDYAVVWEALYACGAADALMNERLPRDLHREYEDAYNIHDFRARNLIMNAIDEVNEKLARRARPDVLPLYYAAFLLHASGACTRGGFDLTAALSAFNELDKYTASFPLRIKVIRLSDNDWTVRMLLANRPEDAGMKIHRSSCILGKARLKYDGTEEPPQSLSAGTKEMF
ncbi:hypothetical protein EV356DRAFT_528280 [Viridothelium virens]|uniref:Zn(2)-C6 fungal-type domain-containing protein n=1 Tax=Viridothelium virens TaxID=1048519 RepID=A0A6A6HPJ0_VIRVR|nr:hypothetical protein EV356DRAFT_528280 [Viridothelium virens]